LLFYIIGPPYNAFDQTVYRFPDSIRINIIGWILSNSCIISFTSSTLEGGGEGGRERERTSYFTTLPTVSPGGIVLSQDCKSSSIIVEQNTFQNQSTAC
jgi:hypothetical protein